MKETAFITRVKPLSARRRASCLLIALLTLLPALFAACRSAPKEPTISEKNGKASFADAYVSCELPSGYFIAVDNTEEMGSAYHAYLMFKKGDDFSGSQIVYYSMHLRGGTYENMVTDRDKIEANLRKSFAASGREVEVVSFKPVTQDKCRGYIIEYKTEANGHPITQIIFNAMSAKSESVTFTFNCTDDSLLPGMREAAESIRLNVK
ncbi:MAG: hypothetical protein J5544_01480 [Clostridia bacterium]|nr:hypothetical protein [Clostridia bacterium]